MQSRKTTSWSFFLPKPARISLQHLKAEEASNTTCMCAVGLPAVELAFTNRRPSADDSARAAELLYRLTKLGRPFHKAILSPSLMYKWNRLEEQFQFGSANDYHDPLAGQ